MRSSAPFRFCVVAFLLLSSLSISRAALPKSDQHDRTAQKSVQGSSLAVRTPGKMVDNAVSQLQGVTSPPPASITETEESGPWDLFMAGLIEAIIAALEDLFSSLAELLFPNLDGGNNDNDCGDNFCDEGESIGSCPADCVSGGQACGNDLCETGAVDETPTNCPEDCTTDGQVCGDEFCEDIETEDNCPDDCEDGGQDCGNDDCEEGETAENCPEDCTENSDDDCGNGECDPGETAVTCPDDCEVAPVCPNGICETGETSRSCPADCR